MGGVAKPIDDITDEDQEMMTPEEYEVRVVTRKSYCVSQLQTRELMVQAYYEAATA